MVVHHQHWPLRAVVYARFSSELQRQESLADQIEICRRYIERQGWKLVDTYEDAAQSGASRFRPEFRRLEQDLTQGRFDVIVVEALDRLGRNLADLAAFHNQLSFVGRKLHAASYGEITPMHVGMMGTMAQMFLSDLREKTKRGLLGKARKGMSAGGKAYGYTVVEPDPGHANVRGQRRINETEAEVVRRIFRNYADGQSPRRIAAALNREHVPGPDGRPWGDTTIRGQLDRATGILNNALYVGRLEWNRCSYVKDPQTGKRVARPNPREEWEIADVPHLRIIDDELWDRVKARQSVVHIDMGAGDGNALNRAHRRQFLLSGLLTCGSCGGAYTIIGKDRYGCATRRSKGTCGNTVSITRQEIEERVLTGLRGHLMAPELIRAFLDAFHAEMKRSAVAMKAEHTAASRRLSEIDRKLAGIVHAIENGDYSQVLGRRLAELETEKEQLQLSLAAVSAVQKVELHPNAVELYQGQIADLAAALATPEARTEAAEILRQLIDRVVLEPAEDGRLLAQLHGDLAIILSCAEPSGSLKMNPGSLKPGSILSVVAGVGFEPTTFRL